MSNRLITLITDNVSNNCIFYATLKEAYTEIGENITLKILLRPFLEFIDSTTAENNEEFPNIDNITPENNN